MAIELSPFRTVVRFRASAPKIYRVDYSWIDRTDRRLSEAHYIRDPDDPDYSQAHADEVNARVGGYPQNRLDEYFVEQPNLELVEITSTSKIMTPDSYSWIGGSGEGEDWSLAVEFSTRFKDHRETGTIYFESEVEGADWQDHIPATDSYGQPIDYYDLRTDSGPVRV